MSDFGGVIQPPEERSKSYGPYGNCPVCGAHGELRLDDYDQCVAGHGYASRDALYGEPSSVARAAGQTVDSAGLIGDPWQAETLLAKLERRGDIDHHQRQAGEHFHRLFQRAGHDPLRAADMARIGGGSGALDPRDHGEAARRQINAVIAVMGGRTSLAGSILWDVIGEDKSMRQWSLMHGRREEVAKGILIATLARLADLWGMK